VIKEYSHFQRYCCEGCWLHSRSYLKKNCYGTYTVTWFGRDATTRRGSVTTRTKYWRYLQSWCHIQVLYAQGYSI